MHKVLVDDYVVDWRLCEIALMVVLWLRIECLGKM